MVTRDLDIPNASDEELQEWHVWAIERCNSFVPPLTKLVEEIESELKERKQ